MPAQAATVYPVEVNTTGFAGLDAVLAFDLIAGDETLGNNSVVATDFTTDGLLSNASDVVLVDVAFFNEELRDIQLGTQLSFILHLSDHQVGAGFDQFSLYLLDPFSLLPLTGTTDPTGADALIAIDITGSVGGNSAVFSPIDAGMEWDAVLHPPSSTAVPESGSLPLLLILSLSALIAFRHWSRAIWA